MKRDDDCETVRPLRRAGRCAEAHCLPFVHPLRGHAQTASKVSGCLQPGATDAVTGGWPDFVELETLRRELNPRDGDITGIIRSMRSFLHGSSTELVRIVGHTLNARRKGMRGRQWWLTPFSASPRIQDRADRKRSRREHSTTTGARFVGRALWSSSQRDERRRRR